MADCLTMISGITGLLQLEHNHPDIEVNGPSPERFSNAITLPANGTNTKAATMRSLLFTCSSRFSACCPSGLLCPQQKAHHGCTCPFQHITAFTLLTFAFDGIRCCHSNATSALFIKMPNCLTASKVAVEPFRDFVFMSRAWNLALWVQEMAPLVFGVREIWKWNEA